MDPQRNLACADSLFTAAQEEGNIRCTGPDIQDHETAAGIFGSAKAEISPKCSTFCSQADRKSGFGNPESAFHHHFFRKTHKQNTEVFPSFMRHFIRNSKAP